MRTRIALVLGMILMSMPAVSTQAQDSEETVRNILLRTGEVGMPSHVESIREFQRGKQIPDEQIRDVLVNLMASSLANEDDPLARELAGNAVRVLSHYGNDRVKGLLRDVIEKKTGSLRRRAIESYMHLVDYSITGVVTNILEETAKYDDMDRRTVYEVYIERTRSVTKESKKIQQAVDAIRRLFEKETDDSNRILLDKFLVERSPDHKVMPLRQEWLTHLESRKVDAYQAYSRQMSVTNSPNER